VRAWLALFLLLAGPALGQALPVFSMDGHDAVAHGRERGYPVPGAAPQARRQPFMVGGFSHFEALLDARRVPRPAVASGLARAERELVLSYVHRGERQTIDSYLERHPATGLLVLRDGVILLERYRYGRRDTHRFTSQSMAKTVTAMLVGIAVAEGRIRSVDDPAGDYVREFAGTELGRTPIRALLQMASGLAFTETYDGSDDAARMSRELWRPHGPGTAAVVAGFDRREAAPGTRWLYAGRDTAALGLVLSRATGKPLAELLASGIWGPIGAEADAAWVLDASGQEAAHCCLSAVLRDWGRLGLLLARDGAWPEPSGQMRQVVPRDWVLAATTAAPGSFLAPGAGGRFYGYGFQTWLLPGARRQFVLLGIHGQAMFVDPQARLVLVHTAVRVRPTGDPTAGELLSLWRALVAKEG
jgi:CubicO group peptidase (beta-lactamase class C family)